MSYTKSPWRVMCDEARGRPRCLIVDARGDEIAAVNPYREASNDNSHLIAASPDMLEFIKEFRQQLESTPNFDYHSFTPWIKADYIIQKAEGES